LEASGRKLHERLHALDQSLERVENRGACPNP
jgi:hypothetical protein